MLKSNWLKFPIPASQNIYVSSLQLTELRMVLGPEEISVLRVMSSVWHQPTLELIQVEITFGEFGKVDNNQAVKGVTSCSNMWIISTFSITDYAFYLNIIIKNLQLFFQICSSVLSHEMRVQIRAQQCWHTLKSPTLEQNQQLLQPVSDNRVIPNFLDNCQHHSTQKTKQLFHLTLERHES